MNTFGHINYDIRRWIRKLKHSYEYVFFKRRIPRPYYVKWQILEKNFIEGATCVETGTYLGETTEFLSKRFSQVFSFEPYDKLATYNLTRFKARNNVNIINSASELGLRSLLKELSGPVNFWLDGHYSGDGTFLSSEEQLSPILEEINSVVDEN